MGRKTTPEKVAAQWALLRHVFDVNVWNFEVRAAQIAESGFKASFAKKRFNDSNSSPWPPRKHTPKPYHPMLKETGTLMNSITTKVPSMNNKRRKKTVKVFTDPSKFGTAARHPGFCYAAVHNSPDSKGFRRGRASNIAQRQFMGNSSVIERSIHDIAATMIFKGFPGRPGII